MSNDFFGNLGNAFSNGFKQVGDAVGGKLKQMGDDTVQNVKDDFKEVSDGVKKGGWIGGAAATFDVLSPGHETAEALNDLGFISNDKNLKQLIAGGVNFAVGTATPGVGILLQLDGLAEGFDGVTGMMKGPKAAPGQPQQAPGTGTPMAPSQGNNAPSQARDEAHARALEIAKMKARYNTEIQNAYKQGEHDQWMRDHAGHVHITDPRPNGGYAPDPTFGNGSSPDLGNVANQIWGSGNINAVNDGLDDILNDPSMSFEDKIFALMQRFVSNDQKAIAKDLKGLTDDQAAQQRTIDAESKQLAGMDPNSAQGQALKRDIDAKTQARSESRQEGFQKIENLTKKLQEMQQALDGVLNAMHDTSMNTIRGIK